jgi:anti-sigma regulatory factor (Ser/Thr protein kinase)
MLSTHLLERIQLDAATTVQRWTLRELASQKLYHHHHHQHQPEPLRERFSSVVPSTNISTELLQCTVQRLSVQHESIRIWKEKLQNHMNPSMGFHGAAAATVADSVRQRLDTLQYIHADTYRLGRQILDHPSNILERSTDADRHVIHSTFLEIRARHAKTIATVVDMVTEWREQQQQQQQHHHPVDRRTIENENKEMTIDDACNFDMWADTFLRRRIGIQLLCDHHVALHRGLVQNGGITVDAPCTTRIIPDAIQEAQHIVDVHLPIVPEVILTKSSSTTTTTTTNHDSVTTCTMVQPWVHHALVELLKNAMLSSVKQMQYDNLSIPTPIYITCQECTNENIVTIEIVDSGTGLSCIDTSFMLGHTTAASKRWDRLDEQQSYATVQAPLSSLGVGLPISRYLLEHFDGSLHLSNNNSTSLGVSESKGCTARVVLRKDDTILERFTP